MGELREEFFATLAAVQQYALQQTEPLRPAGDLAAEVIDAAGELPSSSPVPYDHPDNPLFRQELADRATRRLVDEGGLPPLTYCGIPLWRAMRAAVSEHVVAHADLDRMLDHD